jgi:hypothetical protein
MNSMKASHESTGRAEVLAAYVHLLEERDTLAARQDVYDKALADLHATGDALGDDWAGFLDQWMQCQDAIEALPDAKSVLLAQAWDLFQERMFQKYEKERDSWSAHRSMGMYAFQFAKQSRNLKRPQ